MMFYSRTLTRILDKWPGKRFGLYRFLPFFFALGAAVEFSMIKWNAGKVNFCECLRIFGYFLHIHCEDFVRDCGIFYVIIPFIFAISDLVYKKKKAHELAVEQLKLEQAANTE